MPDRPLAISVIMASYNGAGRVAPAVRSVLRQTEQSLELIFSDDGSNDTSLGEAQAAAAGDPRFIVITGGPRSGPAAARNRAIGVARGRWLAIIDNDDYIHPERLERLTRAAEADGADVAADNILIFHESGARPYPLLRGALARRPTWITAADYAYGNALYSSRPALGYLKPILRRERLGTIRYDEQLRIAEDFDLVMRLLLDGARMRTYPDLGYFYRKHAQSISHRMSSAHVAAMLAAHDSLPAPSDALTWRRFVERRASLVTARAFGDLIAALKASQPGAALAIAAKRPHVLPLLRYPLFDPLGRFLRKPMKAADEGPRRIALLSRQRVMGATNGSSAYLLSIARALTESGYAVDFIGVSPKLFGRWPFYRLKPETDVFASYQVHGAWRLSRVMVAHDPRRALSALLALAQNVFARLKLPTPSWSKVAEYSIAAVTTHADMIHVARAVRANTRAVLCDYAFLAPLAPYALTPDAPTLVVMHDLFSARVRDGVDSVATLTPAEEWRLLGQADVVLAIQDAEAMAVRTALPNTEVMLAPHAVTTVGAAQPGGDDSLLFVGSNTAPNISGLDWFFDACWPRIRAARPNMLLNVAGSVARGLRGAPAGVRLLGVAPNLASYYREAGVVISPLRTGSGLKIKLIEAMAAGKAVVGTTITVQGVESLTRDALVIADEPAAFADAILELSRDENLRTKLGRSALALAQAHFSASACYGAMVARIAKGRV